MKLDFYSDKDLSSIVEKNASVLGLELSNDLIDAISARSRGTPRIANNLLRRTRDFALIKGDGSITIEIAKMALEALDVDSNGLDQMDNKILTTIIDKYNGGPVGLSTIATACSEEKDTIEEVYEPFLIQEGYLKRTSRGRQATALAYKHLKRIPPQHTIGLFDE